MASQKQIVANRRNATKSTGPTTAAGKSTSSHNALKTGLYAKSMIIRGESTADLQERIDDYYRRYRPETPELRSLIDELITIEWELLRLTRVGADMWNYQIDTSWTAGRDKHPVGKAANIHDKAFYYLQRRVDSTRRAQERVLRLVREHCTNPIPVPEPTAVSTADPAPALTLCPPSASSPNGFVPAQFLPEPPAAGPQAELPADNRKRTPEKLKTDN
ncbi:MAG: hypothetical protein ABI759_19935 [Candidatus Solibacter sp.]